jgi:hypothetical protein
MVCEIEPRVSFALAFNSGTGEHWPSNLNVFFGRTGKLCCSTMTFLKFSAFVNASPFFTIVV